MGLYAHFAAVYPHPRYADPPPQAEEGLKTKFAILTDTRRAGTSSAPQAEEGLKTKFAMLTDTRRAGTLPAPNGGGQRTLTPATRTLLRLRRRA
jgi:plasmid stabilization system protein ParE